MNIYHAAALALVDWLLMAAPTPLPKHNLYIAGSTLS
jgi:hypothetical protein